MFQLSWRHQLWRLLGFACPERWAMASRGVHIRWWELCITTLVEPWFRGVEDGHDQNTWVINLQNVVGLLIIGFWVKQSGKDGTKQNWSWMAIHTMVYCELMSFYLLSTSLVAVPNSTTGSESEFPPKSKQDCKWWSCRKRHLDPWDTYQYDGLGIWSHICEWFHFLKDGVGSLILEWNRDIRYLGPLNGIFKVSARTACFLPSN